MPFARALLCLALVVCCQASETLSEEAKVTHHLFLCAVRCLSQRLARVIMVFASYYLPCGQRSPCIEGCKRTTLESYILRKSTFRSPKQ